jgi:hypothetical protein
MADLPGAVVPWVLLATFLMGVSCGIAYCILKRADLR